MESFLTFFGLTCPVGYEYIYFVFKGCVSIFLLVELFGWLKVLTRSMLMAFR
jgi:hypothetical protein